MRLLSCGSNSHGQLGQGNLNDTSSFAPASFTTPHDRLVDLAFGANHTLALCKGETNSTLFGAGSNARGQLGPGSSGNRLEFVEIGLEELLGGLGAVERSELVGGGFRIEGIAAAWETSYVLLRSTEGRSDVLLSMGANDWSELGCEVDGTSNPVDIVDFSSVTSATERLQISAMAAGPRHIVVQLETVIAGRPVRKIVGWGASRHRQLGSLARTLPRTTTLPTAVSQSLTTDSLAQLSVGRDHTAILYHFDEESELRLTGSMKQGQLGPTALDGHATVESVAGEPREGVLANKVDMVGCCWTGTYCVTEDRTQLHACGSNTHHQLAQSDLPFSSSFVRIPLPPNRRIKKLACGSEHVLVILEGDEEAEVWAWGWNEHGNLGDGSLVDVAMPKAIRYEGGGRVVNVWGGNATSWILLDD